MRPLPAILSVTVLEVYDAGWRAAVEISLGSRRYLTVLAGVPPALQSDAQAGYRRGLASLEWPEAPASFDPSELDVLDEEGFVAEAGIDRLAAHVWDTAINAWEPWRHSYVYVGTDHRPGGSHVTLLGRIESWDDVENMAGPDVLVWSTEEPGSRTRDFVPVAEWQWDYVLPSLCH